MKLNSHWPDIIFLSQFGHSGDTFSHHFSLFIALFGASSAEPSHSISRRLWFSCFSLSFIFLLLFFMYLLLFAANLGLQSLNLWFFFNLFALKGNAFYFTFGFNCVLEWNVIPYYQTIKVSSFPLLNIFLSLEECSGCQSSILDYGNCTASFRSMERSVSLADIYKSTCTRQIVSSS